MAVANFSLTNPDTSTPLGLAISAGPAMLSNSPPSNTPTPTTAPTPTPINAPMMSTATQNIQPTNLSNQTFGFGGDPGAGIGPTSQVNFNSNTNQVTPIVAKTPPDITQSTDLGNAPSNGSINSSMAKNESNSTTLFDSLAQLYNQQQQASSNIAASNAISPTELNQQAAVGQSQAAVGEANIGVLQAQQNLALATGQAQGFINPTGQPMDLPALTGQGALKQFQAQQGVQTAQIGVMSAQIQQQLAQTALSYTQGNRQAAFATASKVFDASRQNLSDLVNLYTSAAPQNINTVYNPFTGDVTTTTRNPFTGQESSSVVGNAGIQKQYTDSSIQNLVTGPTFVGVKPDGTVDKIPLYNLGNYNPSSAASGPGATQPTQLPQFQSTGTPSANTSTVGSLLSNWTSGGSSMPGQPYQNAVYKALTDATGKNINANTPTSTLISYIPQMAQGIANAEGWNNPNSIQHTLNNPGNILWANQPNAVPQIEQTSAGPKTFAKFNTMDEGWNAEYNLLAKKLGATQVSQSSQSSSAIQGPTQGTVQAAINQLNQINPQVGGAVQKTAFGHYFLDTTQQLPDGSSMMAGYLSNSQIKAFTPDITQNIKAINTTISNLGSIESLIPQLPTDALDPQRAYNQMQAAFGANPNLARLQEMWQAILPDLQAQVGSQGISRLATGFLTNPNLALVPGVNSIQSVAQAMIDQTKQIMNNREDSIFGGPAPIDYSAAANNILNGPEAKNSAFYNATTQLWNSIFNSSASSLLTVK